MRLEQFEEALSRYGGNIAKWPEPLRADASTLVSGNREAARMVEQASRLDAIMGEATRPVPVDAAMMGRILAGIDNGPHHDVAVQPTRRLAAWAGAAMLTALVAGFVAGIAVPDTLGEDTFAGLMFGASDSAATTIDEPEGVL